MFCEIPESRVELRNNLAYVIYDAYPVTRLHVLVVPKRHIGTYFELTDEERDACHQLLVDIKERIQAEDDKVDGFNIGMNSGESAGQTLPHCHIHLIPRRTGDMENPRGGVRGVIPNKQDYYQAKDELPEQE